jgi:replicative DNA helicase
MLTQDYEIEKLKTPPNSLPAEQSVLGSLMLDNRCWEQVADKLVAADFYRRNHQLIFQVIAKLAEQQQPMDIVTLSDSLLSLGELDNVGGIPYLCMLVEDTPTAANVLAYTDIVKDYAVLRQLIHVGTDISQSAFYPEGRETTELLENAERQVFKLAEQRQHTQDGFIGIKPLLNQTVDKIQQLYAQKGSITGISTGFADFDALTSGLQPADLIIVAGRPSMGKTALSMNIAETVALHSDKPVLVFSMEMPADALAMRMMSSLGRIDQHKVRTGKLEDNDWVLLTKAITTLAETKLMIDDSAALSVLEVRARARRVAREQGQLGLIVIDYLQLMSAPSSGDNRVQQISDISRGLKALAKELSVPVIALSQLNRNLEQRPNKRPIMSDLRDSGAIEQDADLIVFVYRDEVYNPDSEYKGIAEIIIGKQRNGPLGTVNLSFLAQYTRFENFYTPQTTTNDY